MSRFVARRIIFANRDEPSVAQDVFGTDEAIHSGLQAVLSAALAQEMVSGFPDTAQGPEWSQAVLMRASLAAYRR
jgi:hypothetical protein